jgi:hypothetical protein
LTSFNKDYQKMPGISEFTQEFFESSSQAWKANKVRYGQASYKYKKNAFPKEKQELASNQTLASKRQTEKELQKRQSIDEPAPLRERRSPRLRELHLAQTYTLSG